MTNYNKKYVRHDSFVVFVKFEYSVKILPPVKCFNEFLFGCLKSDKVISLL